MVIIYFGIMLNKKLTLLKAFGNLQMRSLNIISINEVDMHSVKGLDFVQANDNNKAVYSCDECFAVGISYNILQ